MSSVAGHQPNLYPYGGFFAKAASVDTFVVVDNTQYVKKEYHNRNRIKMVDGQAHWLTVPVRNAGRYMQKISEVEIDSSKDWRKEHMRTLEFSYRKAPFFDEQFPALRSLLSRDWALLAEFNVAFIRAAFAILGIRTPVLLASEIGASGKATGLILDICRKTGSDTYLHGTHSRDYVDFPLLDGAGVRSLIQDFQCPEYAQINGPFIPNLSILDMLFNCGAGCLGTIMKGSKISER